MASLDSLGTVLGVWAHPDDETYLTAGIMAASVQDGRRVVCVTATRGEEGSQDHERWPPAEMARLREEELASALAILGVDEHRWLDYRDGTCDRVDPNEGADKIAEIMAEVDPDTVVTFGPEGMTGHPDHISVCEWTAAAFGRVARPEASLCYATLTPERAAEIMRLAEGLNAFQIAPPITPASELAIDFSMADDLLDLKMKALKAQASQTQSFIDAIGESVMREFQRTEQFRLAPVKA